MSYIGTETAPVGPVHGVCSDQWTAVDAVVAREEAKAILKASGRIAPSKGKVSPADAEVQEGQENEI